MEVYHDETPCMDSTGDLLEVSMCLTVLPRIVRAIFFYYGCGYERDEYGIQYQCFDYD